MNVARWLVGPVGVALLVALVQPVAAGGTVIAPSAVASVLASYYWTPEAIAWATTTIPVTVDPTLVDANEYGAYFGTYLGGGPHVVVASATNAFVLEHEMHHAWDDRYPQTEGRKRLDLQQLALEPTEPGREAGRVLADPSINEDHLMHALIERLRYNTRFITPWFRERYFRYLGFPPAQFDVPVRLLIPAVWGRS